MTKIHRVFVLFSLILVFVNSKVVPSDKEQNPFKFGYGLSMIKRDMNFPMFKKSNWQLPIFKRFDPDYGKYGYGMSLFKKRGFNSYSDITSDINNGPGLFKKRGSVSSEFDDKEGFLPFKRFDWSWVQPFTNPDKRHGTMGFNKRHQNRWLNKRRFSANQDFEEAMRNRFSPNNVVYGDSTLDLNDENGLPSISF